MAEPSKSIVWIVGNNNIEPIVNGINEAPDRSAAIVSMAIIEERLTELIKRQLIDDTSVKDRLFGLDGAIGAFAIKADLGYLLGLYDKDLKDDLKTLARIRNTFAHQSQTLDFNSQEIKRDSDSLILVKHLLVVDNRVRKGFKEPRLRFLFTVGHILNAFYVNHLGTSPARSPLLRKS